MAISAHLQGMTGVRPAIWQAAAVDMARVTVAEDGEPAESRARAVPETSLITPFIAAASA